MEEYDSRWEAHSPRRWSVATCHLLRRNSNCDSYYQFSESILRNFFGHANRVLLFKTNNVVSLAKCQSERTCVHAWCCCFSRPGYFFAVTADMAALYVYNKPYIYAICMVLPGRPHWPTIARYQHLIKTFAHRFDNHLLLWMCMQIMCVSLCAVHCKSIAARCAVPTGRHFFFIFWIRSVTTVCQSNQ